ncbi:MAG TPA: class F sortase [Thermomicrobiales bacterium]|nr:class F sortase [Thermomicrobiales bacterium]
MTELPHPPREAQTVFELRILRAALAVVMVLGVLGMAPAAATGPSAGFYVASTGHALSDPFLRYWVDHDGATSLGLPVSNVVQRNGRTTQYFQYGVLVLKSNGSTTRLRAGVDLLDELRGDPALVNGRREPSSRAIQGLSPSDIVLQTNVSGAGSFPAIDESLLPYWQQWGGPDLLGSPVSPAYRHGAIRTQWFEYGRIDLGPDGAALAEIGLELARHSDVPTGPEDRGQLPLFDPSRFVAFSGDGTIPNANEPFDPVRIEIPTIRVDASIEITTVQDGTMTNPGDPWKAGWYASFSRPGEWTNTVIAGHRDWWGYGPVVFWNLGLLQPGDRIYLVGADGAGATYVVNSNTLVPRTVDPQSIINDIGYEALTLITCGGAWTGSEYTDRIIIRAYRI